MRINRNIADQRGAIKEKRNKAGVQQLCSCRIKLRNEDPVRISRQSTTRNRGAGKIGGVGDSGDVNISRVVKGNGMNLIVVLTAQITGIGENGIDYERLAAIIFRNAKAELIFADELEAAGNRGAGSIPFLIDSRLVLRNDFSGRQNNFEVAITADSKRLRSPYRNANARRISAGRNNPVIFEISLAAIVSEIDSRIDSVKGNSPISGYVAPPGRRIS